MIPQLKKGPWPAVFLVTTGVNVEDIARFVTMVWDQKDPKKEKKWAVGVFQLKPEKETQRVGCFVFVRASFNHERHNLEKVEHLFSFAKNDSDALLGFLPYMTQQEQEWLMVSLYLRKHPGYK